MNSTPEHRFLGLSGIPDDRALLALPGEGPLKSGQVEAALERRIDEIGRHPLAGSHEAHRLVAHLESAADRLQSAIALEGRGPLHPVAARRVAKRIGSLQRSAEPAPVVIVPKAARRVGSGLTAEDLTEFDRLALAVLVVSGGWNATSAKRLSLVAADHGVSVGDLERVVAGLTRFLSEGEGLRGAMGAVGAQAQTTFLAPSRFGRLDRAEGAVERVFTRIDGVLRDELTSGSGKSQARLAALFGLFALSWIGVLAWVFFGSRPDGQPQGAAGTDGGAVVAGAVLSAPDASSPRGDRDANGEAIVPVAALAAPAKYPRAPGFVPSPPPRAIVESASGGAAWVGDIEQFSRDARAASGHPDRDAMQVLAKAMSAAADAWPAAGAYRGEIVRAVGASARELRGADTIRAFMQTIPGGGADAVRADIPAWQRAWRMAFGAGCLASIALDTTQAPEIAAAAREEMRLRAQPVPRGAVRDAFAAGAVASLSAEAIPLAEALALGNCDLEHASRWAEAVDRAADARDLRNKAALAAIDAALRAPGALDKPGALVDYLAYAIHLLDFTGRGGDPEAVRNALSSWMLDDNIPPARIWALTSLLDADLGIAWYGPDLVLATNAGRGDRAALVERILRAFPKLAETTVGEAVLVDKQVLADWQKAVVTAGALPGNDAADHLRRAAAFLSAARAARAFERGDAKSAKRWSKNIRPATTKQASYSPSNRRADDCCSRAISKETACSVSSPPIQTPATWSSRRTMAAARACHRIWRV